MTWREWELELLEGDAAGDASAAALVAASGGRPSDATKLAKVLGERVPIRPEQVLPSLTRTAPASQVLQAMLLEQVSVIRRYDPLVRRDDPDAVHNMRVAVRRLRSALATYRPLFVREQTEPVRDELQVAGRRAGRTSRRRGHAGTAGGDARRGAPGSRSTPIRRRPR